MHKIMQTGLVVAVIALFTGCESQDEQVEHAQERQQQKLMKEMQKEQDQAQKLSQ